MQETDEQDDTIDPLQLERELERLGRDYLLREAGDEEARLCFTGVFEGRPVVWDCRFLTLRRAGALGPAAGRDFIDIGAPGRHGLSLCVALDIPAIDEPAIRKLMIMIRNYRRLRRGRHEFGGPAAG